MNSEIGERELIVGDLKLVLRPGFESLTAIESDIKKSLPEIFNDLREGHPKYGDIASVIYHTIKDDKVRDKLTKSEIGEQLLRQPLHRTASVVFEMIVYVLSGGANQNDLKKKEPENAEIK
jgi:hypothetical protein